MKKVIVFIADGTEECEALITVDILRRAKLQVVLASVMGRKQVLTSHQIPVEADMLAEEADYSDADAIVLPGGVKGTENLKASALVKEKVMEFYRAGKLVCAICAAPTVFADLGLLNGKTATVNPGFEAGCPNANLTHTQAAQDGNIITGQAVGATFEFALLIVKNLLGEETEAALRKNICY